ncbi:MAG TPA: GTP 3',8-cyclase MoaA [Polyangiaceae bacterium]|nr:GTP 3',8-cyclase MoaA [Polyangiaceae bacterium]
MRDSRGRALSDLRISVTDRCNFRCSYCLPRDKVDVAQFLPKRQVLTFEEITRIARQFVDLGTSKLRITGGEPLLRRDLPTLIAQLAPLGAEIALTTNGVLLGKWAAALRAAGLHRVTVSLDALDDEVFQRMCDAPGYTASDVLAGIDAALHAGFERVKVNCVVRRGHNEEQIVPLVRALCPRGVEVRFIEYMDVGTLNGWEKNAVVTREEILERLSAVGTWSEVPARQPSDVARQLRSELGVVGVIASVSAPFCGDCSRARLSADGKLFGCLFAERGLDLKARLRAGESDALLRQSIEEFWHARSDRYSELRREQRDQDVQLDDAAGTPRRRHLPTVAARVEMAYIGG